MCPTNWRRRSADIGGLQLATEGDGHGKGWAGDGELKTRLAELLYDMYNNTLNVVNDSHINFEPTTLSDAHRQNLVSTLDSWNFQPHTLSEDDLVSATLLIFEAIFRIEGMQAAVGVTMAQLTPFIHHLRLLYRFENTYHNFEHALDVLQATHSYLHAARVVPPLQILLSSGTWSSTRQFDCPGKLITTLGLRDIFALYIAAIGHDVGHPGFTNTFMKNAGTPLYEIFKDESALEQLHCQLLIRVMRAHGLSHLLDDYAFRKILWYSIMATDMKVHDNFMSTFESLIRGKDRQQGPVLMRKIVVCQAVLKCADISNPSRPFEVSAYWASALGREWSQLAMCEQGLAIQPSVETYGGPLKEANGQVFFSSKFVAPLLNLVVRAVPEMKRFSTKCQLNLEAWQDRKRQLESSHASQPPPPSTPSQPSPPSYPLNEYPSWLAPYLGVFPMALPTAIAAGNDWAARSRSGSTTSGSGAESAPTSPSASSSTSDVSSFSTPQATRLMPRPRPPSQASSTSGIGSGVSDYSSIRSAACMGARKTRKEINRNSWSFRGEEDNSAPPRQYSWLSEAPPPSAPNMATLPRMPLPPPPPASAPMQMQTGSSPPLQLRIATPRSMQGFRGVGVTPKIVVAGPGVESG